MSATAEVAKATKKPYLNERGDLITPTDCERKYRYWDQKVKSRLSLCEILVGVGADEATILRYVRVPGLYVGASWRHRESKALISITEITNDYVFIDGDRKKHELLLEQYVWEVPTRG